MRMLSPGRIYLALASPPFPETNINNSRTHLEEVPLRSAVGWQRETGDGSCSLYFLVQPNTSAHRQIVQLFGHEVLLESGEINREKLGSIIFSSPEKRQQLNTITHPEIHKIMLKQILKYFFQGYRFVILDIPLLFETNKLTRFMKHTILVYCDPQSQLARLMKRNNLSHPDAEARIFSQLPLDEKRRLADHVIDNSGDRERTRQQVLELHARLDSSMDYIPIRLVAIATLTGISGLAYLLLRHFIF